MTESEIKARLLQDPTIFAESVARLLNEKDNEIAKLKREVASLQSDLRANTFLGRAD